MSQFNHVFDGKDYFECQNCGSLAIIDEQDKLMRMIETEQGFPVIYEEKNREAFITDTGQLKCVCDYYD